MNHPLRRLGIVAVLSLVVGGCSQDGMEAPAAPAPSCDATAPETLRPRVVREIPHDPTAFTQGLVVLDDVLYESDGLVGQSRIRAIDPGSGNELRSAAVDPAVFAEGLAVGADDQLVQLTWTDERAFVWTPAPVLEQSGELEYEGEGWGLTTLDDGTFLMSDGTDVLVERDPGDFTETDRWPVRREGGGADQLNELEWDGDHAWANRWKTDEIVRIDVDCQRVDAVVDASALTALAGDRAAATPGATDIDVLNGIAHLPGTDRFIVTGKHWPVMFEVTFDAA